MEELLNDGRIDTTAEETSAFGEPVEPFVRDRGKLIQMAVEVVEDSNVVVLGLVTHADFPFRLASYIARNDLFCLDCFWIWTMRGQHPR
jgi:hypothetical protein